MESLSPLDVANRIYEIGLLANQQGGLSAVLGAISRRVLKDAGASYVGIVLVDRRARELVHHQGALTEGEVPEGHRQPLRRGVLGQVAQSGKPSLIADVTSHPSYFGLIPGMKSEVAVPLELHGEVIGVLNVESDEAGRFTDLTLAWLLAISTSVAQAVENARLFEDDRRHMRQLTMLNKVSRVVTSTNGLDELLDRTVETLQTQLDHYLVAIALVSDDGKRIVLEAIACRDDEGLEPGHSQAIGEGINGEVVRTGNSLLIPDTKAWFNYVPFNDTVRSEICCPLKVGGRVIGTIDVESTQPDAYDYGDLLMLESIADHLSQAVQNARTAKRLAQVRENLLGMLVDDLQRPLAAVKKTLVRVGAVVRRPGMPSDLPAEVDDARRECEEIHELGQGLLNLRRIYSGDLELVADCDLGELVDRVRERFDKGAKKQKITLKTSVAKGLPDVELDVDLVEQVLCNLVSNAIKQTPARGKVKLDVAVASRAVLESHSPGCESALLFSVSDTGSGVDQEEAERIFSKHGAGLGLAFCRNAVSVHGGAIWFDAADPGSVFHVLLPAG